jgi:polysaccharide export outer membrane protein
LRAYRRALEIDPYMVPALINLANLHYSRDDVVEAQALYERAIALEPDVFEAHFNLGNIFHDLARYIEAPQVDVSILTYASQRVWVTGASRQAATVPLTVTPLTLGDAISQSGLDATQADLSGVRLTREGVTYSIDLDRLGRQGGGATNIFLKASDHLYVPYLDRKEVFVVGEVNQPGAMSFKTSDISLSQALGRARGLQQSTSNGNAVYVIRGTNDLQNAPSTVFHLEARSPAAFAVASQFELLPGDVVFVGAAGVTRWSRFVNQLLPFTSIISNAASARNDLDN